MSFLSVVILTNANQPSNMAAIAKLSLTLDPVGNTNLFFSITTEQNETKHGRDAHYKILSKCCYFGADWPSNMAAIVKLRLT